MFGLKRGKSPVALGLIIKLVEILSEACDSALLCFAPPKAPAIVAKRFSKTPVLKIINLQVSFIGRYSNHQPGPYSMRRNTSQEMVATSSQKADSRYQVSDFWEWRRLETRLREESSRVSMVLYFSNRFWSAAVDSSNNCTNQLVEVNNSGFRRTHPESLEQIGFSRAPGS